MLLNSTPNWYKICPVSITRAKVMAVWSFAKNLQNFLTTNTTNMTLTATHTHWNTDTTMVVSFHLNFYFLLLENNL